MVCHGNKKGLRVICVLDVCILQEDREAVEQRRGKGINHPLTHSLTHSLNHSVTISLTDSLKHA